MSHPNEASFIDALHESGRALNIPDREPIIPFPQQNRKKFMRTILRNRDMDASTFPAAPVENCHLDAVLSGHGHHGQLLGEHLPGLLSLPML